ncbi:alpha/beta hydrolase [Mucilaginibacter defluvii]|uniref:Alpha/beta hydrolase n=1 Tax=Mucilaginibacter defluvii TaxID=1196019 RepID=A0ABP9G4J2_9SPHI
MENTTNFKNVNGRDIFYVDFGRGTPVVLLHSTGGSGRDFIFQTSALVNAGFRVIIPDIAGHGATKLTSDEITLKDLVKDVWGLLDALEISDANFVGLSMGGMITLKAAVNRTQRVKKAVLINSSWNTDTEAFKKFLPAWKEKLTSGPGTTKWFNEGWKMLVNDAFSSSALGVQTFQIFLGNAAMSDGRSVATVLDSVSGVDLTGDLSEIRSPILMISGGDDPASEAMKALEHQLPRAKHFVIPGGRHMVNVDSAEKVNERLIHFLQH